MIEKDLVENSIGFNWDVVEDVVINIGGVPWKMKIFGVDPTYIDFPSIASYRHFSGETKTHRV